MITDCAVPSPPVARAPVLQCVKIVAPSGTSAAPFFPMATHISASSRWISIASANSACLISATLLLTFRRQTARIRSTAQKRFFVGRVCAIIAAERSNAIVNSLGEAEWKCCVPKTMPYAAAIPRAGAPRTLSIRMASASTARSSVSTKNSSIGSRVWSMNRTLPLIHSMLFIKTNR